MLTNREIATLILLGAVMSWTLSSRSVRESASDIYRSFTNPKVLAVIGAYLLYAVLLIGGAWYLELWEMKLLKDTVLVVLITGMGMVMSANVIKSGAALTKKTVYDVIGLTAIITFYVNLSSFSIPIEVIVQGLLALITMLSVVAKHQKNIPESTAKFFDTLLVIGGVCLLAKATVDIQKVWQAEGADGVLGPLPLSIWFPLMLLPFVYSLSFIIYMESMLRGLRALNDNKHVSLSAFLALLIGLRFSVKYARGYAGHWRLKFLDQRTLKGWLGVMNAYRKDIQEQEKGERLEVHRLKRYAGVDGEDEHGKRLDRREFKETCRLLTDLYFYQRGMHVNRGKYFDQPLILLNDSKYYGLGENQDLAVTAHVASNKHSWYAWRRTPSGWVFAIGGTKNADEQWRYDGPEPPSNYPSARNQQWSVGMSTNWVS